MKQGANSLTPKQHAFVMEFMIDRNGTQAAIRAGYSERTANEQAARLLANVSVAAAVNELTKARAERVLITADDVLSSIKRIRDKAEADEKNGDALKANELLGKHLKLFTDKVEHSGEFSVRSLSEEQINAKIAEYAAKVK